MGRNQKTYTTTACNKVLIKKSRISRKVNLKLIIKCHLIEHIMKELRF
jgi:hypothetical protein